jgi:hypothetical protein
VRGEGEVQVRLKRLLEVVKRFTSVLLARNFRKHLSRICNISCDNEPLWFLIASFYLSSPHEFPIKKECELDDG